MSGIGQDLECILRQKQIEKRPEVKHRNEDIALDFAGPFRNTKKGEKYVLVSIDHFSSWPVARFLHRPTTKKVIEFF